MDIVTGAGTAETVKVAVAVFDVSETFVTSMVYVPTAGAVQTTLSPFF